MKKIHLLSSLLLLFAVTLFFPSCKSEDGDYQISNQDFLNEAATFNAFQISAGDLAQSKGSTESVKQYGAKMVTEFTSYKNELAVLVASKGWTTPTTVTAAQEADLIVLRALSGTAFDSKYKEIMVSAGQNILDSYQTSSGKNGVFDADLRNYAKNKIVYLESHLATAKTL
ncbi:DUF4142 domain-containing protein [Pedobacter sp. AW31-3R]|uniref:DUF4142 domain-containing protein n=1 Tax=Pedobacter sp. AW31-3R TaxID=3445781 RepID=UPI003FA0EFA5